MQFYLASIKGDLAGQDVVNTFAWRRNSVGLPQDSDLAAVADYVQNEVIGAIRAMQVTGMVWKQITVQGYRDTWGREPYLPLIRDVNLAGMVSGTSVPPVVAITVSFRVQPIQNAPTGKPVRRGYIHLAGMSEGFMGPNGTWDASLTGHAGMAAICAELVSKPIVAGAPEALEPIRVSAPDRLSQGRGYGLALQAVCRNIVTTRRSRLVGKGG